MEKYPTKGGNMPKANKTAVTDLPDDIIVYQVDSNLVRKGKSGTAISKESAIEQLTKIAKQLPPDPS